MNLLFICMEPKYNFNIKKDAKKHFNVLHIFSNNIQQEDDTRDNN